MAALPRSLTKLMPGRKRGAARAERGVTVHLFGEVGLRGAATMLDESRTGARLAGVDGEIMDGATHLLNARTGEAHKIELAWSNAPEFGIRYVASASVRVYVEPEFEPLKRFWAAAGLGAPPR